MPLILHVTNSLGVNGGAEQQLVSNLQRFGDSRLTHRLVALFADDEGALRTSDIPDSIVVDFLFGPGERPSGRRDILNRLDAEVGRIEPDLIHCSVSDASLASRIVGRRRDIPVVETLVNISHERVRAVDNPNVRPWKLAVYKVIDRVTMRSVARFHALTPAVAESWQRTVGVPAAKMVVIPRGVDLDAVVSDLEPACARARLFAELGVDNDPLLVLNVGRQTSQKGQRYLVEAMDALSAERDVVLVIAGQSGTNTAELAAMAAARPNVYIIGARDDVPDLMAAADVFAFPSLFEGLGVSLLEAMAHALPVITTDVAPMNAIVTHRRTGLLVPPRDPHALAVAIDELASDPVLARSLGHAAHTHVATDYRLDEAAASIEHLYADVLMLGS
jgi:glycosyltransferase involved in cell wall biosynthesis